MHVMVIPDQHQRIGIFSQIEKEWPKGVDTAIFLGDLVDDWNSKDWWTDKDHNPINCIKKLSSLKDKYGDKFIWLLGNHDLTYIPAITEAEKREQFYVSGHQSAHHTEISTAFEEVRVKWQIAVTIDGVVYSHAGITKDWLKSHRVKSVSQLNKIPSDKMHEYFDHCSMSSTGDDTIEGPLWVRPTSLLINSAFPKQVVGHTEISSITLLKAPDAQVLLIDSPDHDNVAHIIDGNIEVTGVEVQEFTKKQIDSFVSAREQRLAKLMNFFL